MASVNNVSLTAPTDYALEQQKIARQQKLAEALQQQAFTASPTEFAPGGWAVKQSPLGGLGRLAQAFAGMQMQNKADARLGELATQQRDDQSADMGAIARALQGTPAQPAQSGMVDEVGGINAPELPAQTAKPGGLQNLDMNALRTPEARQMLVKLMTEQAAKANEPYSLAPGATRYGAGGQPVVTAPVKAEPFTLAPGAIRFGPDGKQIIAAPEKVDNNKPFNADGTPNTAYQDYEKGLRIAGKTSIQNTVNNAGPKAFETEMGKSDAEQIGKWRAGAEAGQNTLQTIGNLKQAIADGTFSGGLAGAKTAGANLINGLTGLTMKNLPGSERFTAEANTLILDRIKALGTNPSNADRDFLAKTIPNIGTSPQARDSLINFMEQKANQQIDLYKRADTYGREHQGMGGFEMYPQQRRATDKAGSGWSVVK